MTRYPWLLAVLSLILVGWPAVAQEVALKLKQPAVGDAVQVKRNDQLKVEFSLTDVVGNTVRSRKETTTMDLAYQETGLERADGARQFTSLKRDYQKAERIL